MSHKLNQFHLSRLFYERGPTLLPAGKVCPQDSALLVGRGWGTVERVS